MREFSRTQISEIERKIREMSQAASSYFTSLTGTNITGSNLLYTSGTFGEISATVGKFHILSATYNNLAIGTASGTLATFGTGIFDVLTGTLISGSSLFITSGTIQNLAVLSGTFGTGTFSELSSTIGKFHIFSASNGLIIVATGTSLTYTNATIQNTTGLNAVFTNLTGTNLTGSNLLFTSGTIQNLFTLSATINTASFNEISATIGRFHIFSASFALTTNITGSSLNFTNGNIQTLAGLAANYTNLTGTNLTGSSLFYTNGAIQNLTVLSATINTGTFNLMSSTIGRFHIFSASFGLVGTITGTTLAYTNGTIQNLSVLSATINTGTFNELSSTIGRFHIFTASFGSVNSITGTTLNYTNGNIQTLAGLSANYTNLTGSFITGSSLLLTSAQIQMITASVGITGSSLFFTNGTIQNLIILSATINTGTFNELSSTIGRFHLLSASFGLIGTLTGTTLNYTNGNIQTLAGLAANYTNLTGTNLTGSSLFFTNGTIQNLNVLSGTINTGTFNELSSTIGKFHILSASFGLVGSITGTTLNYTNGNIQTLAGLSANYTNLTGTYITGSSLLLTSAQIQTITASVGLTGSNLFFTNGTIQNLNILSATINTGTFNEMSSTIGRFHILSATHHNIGGSSSGSLATYNIGIFDILTGTITTGSTALYTNLTSQNMTSTVGFSGSVVQGTTLTIQSSSIYKKGSGTTIVCGNDITSLVRSSQAGITGTTLTNILTITSVPPGRYRLNAMVIWQADAATTGLDVAVGFGGTTTKWYMEHRFATTGGAAATAAASGAAKAGTGNLYEAQGQRTVGAVIGSGSVSTDAVNSDTMSIIEGFFVVSVAGDLTIKAAAENASLAIRVQEGTNILLHKLD